MERFEKVKQRYKILTELEAESVEITKRGNFIAFEKQAANIEAN